MDTLLNWSLPIFICISGIAYFYIWNKRKELEKENVQTLVNPYEGMGVKELLDKVLRDINCEPLWSEEEKNALSVTFQGERFTIETQNDSPFILITDAWWHVASLEDIEQFSLIRQAINNCNQIYPSVNLIYTTHKEDKTIGIHTRQSVIFMWQIPNVKDYLRSRFEASFHQHHNFYHQMEELRQSLTKECKKD